MAALAGLLALFGVAQGFDMDSLPPPPSGAPVARADAPEAAALDENVTTFARGHFTIGEPRYFLVEPGISWQPVVKLLRESPPLQRRAERVRFGWERPGLDLVEVLDLGRNRGVAVAMRERLVGYYPVTFVKSGRKVVDSARPG